MNATNPDRPTAQLDVRGLFCPLPVLLAVREIAKLPPGGWLVVEGDDPGMLEDLPAWCETSGHRLVEIGAIGAVGAVEEPSAEGPEPAPEGVAEGAAAPAGEALIRAVIEKAAG